MTHEETRTEPAGMNGTERDEDAKNRTHGTGTAEPAGDPLVGDEVDWDAVHSGDELPGDQPPGKCDWCYGYGMLFGDVGPDVDERPAGTQCPMCNGTGTMEKR